MSEARLPLTFDITSRSADTSKDSRAVNVIMEGEDVVKRPGLAAMNLTGTAIVTGVGQGIFSWANQMIVAVAGHVYSIVGNTVTELTGSPFSGQSTVVPLSFSSTINDTWMAYHDGTNLFVVNSINNTILSPLGGTGVLSATITNNGGYYSTPPTVTFSGATPATGTAVLYNNQVSSITMNSSGTYVSGTIPTITISAPPAGTQATYTVSGAKYSGTEYVMTTQGSSYTSAPTAYYTYVSGPNTVAGYTLLNSTGNLTDWVCTVSSVVGVNGIYIPPPVETTATATANMNSTIAGPFVPGIVYLDSSMYVMTTGQLIPATLTVTISNASPAVVTWNNHGQSANTQVVFSTTGSLPSPLVAGTIYYILTSGLTTNTFEVSLTVGGVAVNTSSAGSGTQTATASPQTPSVIYGSAMNNPTSWNALNYIDATSDADLMVGIARHLNYIVAFGTSGTQFFYDDALPVPASPLAENKSAYLEIGCANGYSIAQAEMTVIWVSTSVTEGRSVYMLDGLSPMKLSTRYVEKYLNQSDITPISTNVRAYTFKIAGHTLYVLTLKDINITLVYDMDEKRWYQWTSQTGDTGTPDTGTETYFKATSFNGNIEYNTKGIYLQDDSSGVVYTMSPQYYNDNSNLIYFRLVSPRLDSGSKKRKFYQRVEAIGDSASGNLWYRKFDDDYATPSTYRAMNLAVDRPVLYQLGASRRRAHELFSSDNIPIRLQALEIGFEIGEQEQAASSFTNNY